MLSENVEQSCLNNIFLNISVQNVEQNVVQVVLINILDQHRVFAQHLGQMMGDVDQDVDPID